MTKFLAQTFRTIIHDTYKHQVDTMNCINKVVKGRTGFVSNKKYEKCHAVIQEYYFDGGKEYLRVLINNQVTEIIDYDDWEFA
jgi:hypothetical protein